MSPEITAILLNYNGLAFVEASVGSLVAAGAGQPLRILLVDNASTDGSRELLEHAFPELDLLSSPVNRGYAGGNNLAIRSVSTPFVLLVNHDIRLEPDAIEWMRRAIAGDPGVAAVTPKILYEERPAGAGAPAIVNAAGIAPRRDGHPVSHGRGLADDGGFDAPREVFGAHGACVLYRRSALDEVGLFDERYFAYHEEFDLAWRLRLLGHRTLYEPRARAHHREAVVLRDRRDHLLYLMERNRIWTLFKNAGSTWFRRAVPALLRTEWEMLRHCAGLRTVVPLRARWDALKALPAILASRREIQSRRCVGDDELEAWIVD